MTKRYLYVLVLLISGMNLYGERGPQIISPTKKDAPFSTLQPVFTWKPISKPGVFYEIKIAEDPEFTINVIQLKTNYSYIKFSLPYFKNGLSYYWTVRASYSEGTQQVQTSWTHEDRKDRSYFQFTINQTATGSVGRMPDIVAPENNSASSTLQPVFRWFYPIHSDVNFSVRNIKNEWVSPELKNITYQLQISTTKDFTKENKIFEIKNDSTNFRLTIPWLRKGQKYYWRIKASYIDPEKLVLKVTEWSKVSDESALPFSFDVSPQARGTFGFNEGQKEEVFQNSISESLEKLTNGAYNCFSPALSKDGQRLAYCSDRSGSLEIYEMILSDRMSGSGSQRTSSQPGKLCFNPFWLSSDVDIAFYSNKNDDNIWHLFGTTKGVGIRIYDDNLDNDQDRNDFELFGSCSSDGKIVYTSKLKNNGTYDLNMKDLNTNTRTSLLPGMFPDIRTDDRIVYASNKSGNWEIMLGILEPNGIFDPTILAENSASDYDPVFSPDGTRISFTSTRSGNSDIWVMNSDGTGLYQVTNHCMVDRRPQWVNNESIVFQSNRPDDKGEIFYQIYRMKIPKNKN
jgi:Tol biopolymer transport system component